MKIAWCKEFAGCRGANWTGRAVLLLSGLLLLTGCPASKQASDAPATLAADKIVIRGSHTIGEELAPRLIVGYKKEHPTVIFDLESIKTGYGLAQLRAGHCDIAGASRSPVKEEVELAQTADIEMVDYIIGSYSVAVTVNTNNSVASLTREQVRDIFSGVIQNWKDVGGSDAPIHLYVRDPISGTYLGFQELAMENQPYAAGLKTYTNYATLVEAVAADVNGIGYSGIDLAKVGGVKNVLIGGVPPTAESVTKGEYPYARVLRFYTVKGKESQQVKDFLKFAQGPGGQKIIAELGLVPHQ